MDIPPPNPVIPPPHAVPEPPPEPPQAFVGAVPGRGKPLFSKILPFIPIVVMLLVGFGTYLVQTRGSLDVRSRASGIVPTPMPTSSVPLTTDALQLRTITLALLSLNSDRKKVSGTQATALITQIEKLAKERNLLLRSALRTSPEIIGDSLLGSVLVQDFVPEVQQYFEKEYAQNGVLEYDQDHFIFDSGDTSYRVYIGDTRNLKDPASMHGKNMDFAGFLIGDALYLRQLSSPAESVQGAATDGTCVPNKPEVAIAPTNQFGKQGEQLEYKFAVTNKNSGCKTDTFTFAYTFSTTDIEIATYNQTLSIAEGNTVYTPITVSSVSDAAIGAHTISVLVKYSEKPFPSASASATYTVFPRD